MASTEEFRYIVYLGSFHTIKIYLSCIDKYLRNSGVRTFEQKTESLDQTLQNLSLVAHKGMTLLCEAIEGLQWYELFKATGTDKYKRQSVTLCEVQNAFAEIASTKSQAAQDRCRVLLNKFKASSSEMRQDFINFKTHKCDENGTFKYWDTFIRMVSFLRNLLRVDREGNWALHLRTFQFILPFFAIFDCPSYLRWCSVYI